MRMRQVLLLGIGLFAFLACNHPGITPEITEQKRVQLGGVHVMATPITSPHVLQLPRSGELILEVGNPSKQPITLNFDHAEPARVQLAPKRWRQIHLRTDREIQLEWDGAALQLGSWYLKPSRKPKTPNVLLVSVDTLRWDRFTPERMPGLSALFDKGVKYERAYSPTPWTLPAHASMLSGQYPARHGVRQSDEKLSREVITLGERLTEAGYYSWAMTEGNFVSARYGLNQGFHRYVERSPAMMAAEADKVTKLAGSLQRVRQRMKSLKDVPQFLFLHTYEVHCPYLPHGDGEDPEGIGQTQWLLDQDGDSLPPETYAQLRALYDGEVAFTDEQLTPFLSELWQTGEWLIVFTSDHGEEFGDHGGLLHGDNLYEEALHVPLAVIGPQIAPVKINEPCSLIDIAPTILSYLGLDQPATWQGQALQNGLSPRPVFAESFFWGVHVEVENPRLLSVIENDKKLIQWQNFGQTKAELYLLDRDPLEQNNLQTQEVGMRDTLFRLLEAYLANQTLTPEQREALTPEQLEALRALGYVD